MATASTKPTTRRATLTAQQRSRLLERDAGELSQVRWRLAALTVGLLCALLVVMGASVYLITQRELYSNLTAIAQQRVESVAYPLRYAPLIPFGRPPGRPGVGTGATPGYIRSLGRLDADNSGLFLTIADTTVAATLKQRWGVEVGVTSMPDPATARAALDGTIARSTSERQVDGHPYLVYTLAVNALRLAPSSRAAPYGVFDLPQGTLRRSSVAAQPRSVKAVVQIRLSEDQYRATLSRLLEVLVLVSTLGLLAAGAISALVVQRALQPIRVALRRQRDFVADAAHELRTPLTIMRTAVELGMTGGGATDEQAALEQTLVQNAHLTRLVDSLSLLARADSGVLTIERQPLDLATIARETVEGVAILAEEQEVHLSLQGASALPMLGDAGRLRQLLLIMLDNALKHTPAGGAITVTLEAQHGRVHVQVQDTGPGIDPRDLPHLFDRFYRADRARSGDGMGLGLAIGRWIAEAHGGHITAANAPDRGALFTVVLPAAR